MRSVYLDNYSATPVLPEVFDAMRPFFTESFGNASSLHQYGLRARNALANARAQIAAFINADSPDNIIFTSDGTESSNLAVKGVALASQRKGNHIVYSAIEHPAVLSSIEFLEKQGFTGTPVKVDREGLIDPEAVRAAITDKTVLIAIHHANHDIGAIEPIKAIGAIAAEKGIPLYVDCEASAGWLPIDVKDWGASLVSFSPHRFYGPKGVGILYRSRKARLSSILHGGAQENGHRSGVENIPAIVGGALAAEIAGRELSKRAAQAATLQSYLWEGLQKHVPYICLNGPLPGPKRLPGNLNISTEFIEGEGQLLRCDIKGIAVASGSSCVSKSLKSSHVLDAIGLDQALAQGNLIFTLGKDNTKEEMDYVIETFPQIVATLRSMSPMWDEFEKGMIDSVVHPKGQGKSFGQHASEVTGRPSHS